MFNSKKLMSAISAFTLATALCAAQNKNNAQSDQTTLMQRPPEKEITPNAGPKVMNGADVYLTADFIWWKAHQDGLEYVAANVANPFETAVGPILMAAASPITTQGTIREPNFKFRPGFKVGAGLDLQHDGWDLYLNYTWLRSNKNKSSATASDYNSIATYNEVYNTIISTAGATPPFSNSANWNLKSFNVLDLELGRNFYISRYLALRPNVGLKGTWQRQGYTLASSGNDTAEGSVLAIFNSSFGQKLGGLGIRGGLNTTWYFCKNFSLFGDLYATTLWSRFTSTRDDNFFVPSVPSNPLALKSTYYRQDTLTSVIEFSLGLRGETWFNDDCYHFAADIGWEEQIWYAMNNFYNVYEHDSHGKLALHGLTVKVRFDF